MAVPSVISSSSKCGGRPDSAKACSTSLTMWGSTNWRIDRFTATRGGVAKVSVSRPQRAACWHASFNIHRPMGTICPLSSAIGMNWTGEMRPICAWCQRMRASNPINRLEPAATCGWYSARNSWRSTARCRSLCRRNADASCCVDSNDCMDSRMPGCWRACPSTVSSLARMASAEKSGWSSASLAIDAMGKCCSPSTVRGWASWFSNCCRRSVSSPADTGRSNRATNRSSAVRANTALPQSLNAGERMSCVSLWAIMDTQSSIIPELSTWAISGRLSRLMPMRMGCAPCWREACRAAFSSNWKCFRLGRSVRLSKLAACASSSSCCFMAVMSKNRPT